VAVGVLTAGLTAYYMFRMLFVTFLGAYRATSIRRTRLAASELAGTANPHAADDEHVMATRTRRRG